MVSSKFILEHGGLVLDGSLRLEGLTVEVAGKKVLQDIDLEVPEGQVHVLLGPNGSGKSSLLMTVMGVSRYKVKSGRIAFKEKDITSMPIHERVRLGLGVAFQNPPVIRGVKLKDMLEFGKPKNLDYSLSLAENLKISREFLSRDLNLGFSGGETKRSEILQVLSLNPDFHLLDEPDSGVDVENLEVIGRLLNSQLKGKSGLLVTHLGHLLKYLKPDLAHVLINGKLACSGETDEIIRIIMESGYEECKRCLGAKRKPSQH